MVFERMHVLADQLLSSVVAEYLCCGRITKQAGSMRITAKDSFSRRIENQASSLVTFLQGFFCLFSFADVFRQSQHEPWCAFIFSHQRHVVSYPYETAIFATVLLLDLKLISLALQQFFNEGR